MKKTILIIIAGVVIFAFFAKSIFFKKQSTINTPLSNFMQQIAEQRYKDGKVIRVYLKRNVSDEEGTSFVQELKSIDGINGINLTSKAAQELMKENSYLYLYPEKTDTLNPGSHIIIDVDVENIQDKDTIIQQIKKKSFVEAVADLKAQ